MVNGKKRMKDGDGDPHRSSYDDLYQVVLVVRTTSKNEKKKEVFHDFFLVSSKNTFCCE